MALLTAFQQLHDGRTPPPPTASFLTVSNASVYTCVAWTPAATTREQRFLVSPNARGQNPRGCTVSGEELGPHSLWDARGMLHGIPVAFPA